MGDVMVTAKIYVEDPSKFESIKAEISKIGKLADARVEEVGFGVKALKVLFIVPDSVGGDMEEKLNAIPGVSQAQIEEVTLV
ncbi:MAG: elongation factor 1-beta [Candidatus Micrarchaeota archaeon]|nr:elongation factor 1-beta [Candidatus Micrarchaeota archaeon]